MTISQNGARKLVEKLGYTLLAGKQSHRWTEIGLTIEGHGTQGELLYTREISAQCPAFEALAVWVVKVAENRIKIFSNLADLQTWASLEVTAPSQEPTDGYVKVMIPLVAISTDADYQAIVEALKPGALFEPWAGLCWLITRYPTRELANARALDAESTAYCGRAVIEESWQYQDEAKALSPAELVHQRILNAPTPPRIVETW